MSLSRVVNGATVAMSADEETVVQAEWAGAARANLIAYNADARWRRETGGISISGVWIATDDRSKIMVQGAFLKASQDPSFTTQWKIGPSQSVNINAGMIVAIANAIGDHVAACFAKEAEVSAAIADGTVTTPAQVDAAFAAI